MPKYHSFSEVLIATIAKYENAERLCRGTLKGSDDFPMYSHVNGIGCAIGCHLSPEDAVKMDEDAVETGDYGWLGLIRASDRAKALHVATFGDIDRQLLGKLQSLHDVASFRYGDKAADREQVQGFVADMRLWLEQIRKGEVNRITGSWDYEYHG